MEILYFKKKNGASPIFDFIESLDMHTQAKVFRSLDLLEEFGVRMGLPHTRKLANSHIWELRILGKNHVRFLYIVLNQRNVLFLHGFKKKSQKISMKDIKTAMQRYKNYCV